VAGGWWICAAVAALVFAGVCAHRAVFEKEDHALYQVDAADRSQWISGLLFE
jgi:hypothetical protein